MSRHSPGALLHYCSHDYKYGHATVVWISRKTQGHGNGTRIEGDRFITLIEERAYVSTKVINKNKYVISNVTQLR